jgi:hypothetical protein
MTRAGNLLMTNRKIAICFFGITRSLTFTIQNIVENVITPARELGEVKIFCHFFDQKKIDNPRSGESFALNTKEYELLNADDVVLEKPDAFLLTSKFKEVTAYGDAFGDGHVSTRNLFHQLRSLNCVTNRALAWNPDIVIFLRPDLFYHDSFLDTLKKAVQAKEPCLHLPNWQHWGGMNDRFSVAVGKSAIKSYGQRYDSILDYCSENNSPIQSEKLLKYSLKSIKCNLIKLRATRVRGNGDMKNELFHHYKIIELHSFLANKFGLAHDNIMLSKVTWAIQRLFFGNPLDKL